jgi:hypothetical protein
MPQAAPLNITVAGGTHTFNPSRAPNGVWTFRDTTNGVVDGQITITSSAVIGQTSSQSSKVTMQLRLPTLETISGSDGGFTPAARKAYECFAKIEIVIPNRSTATERGWLQEVLSGAVNNSLLKAQWVNPEPVY